MAARIPKPSPKDVGSIDAAIVGAEVVLAGLRQHAEGGSTLLPHVAAAARLLDSLRLAKREALALMRGDPLRAPAPIGHANPPAESLEEASDDILALEQQVVELLRNEGSMPMPEIAARLNTVVMHVRDAIGVSSRLVTELGEIRLVDDSTERLVIDHVTRVGPQRLSDIANAISRNREDVTDAVRRSKRLTNSAGLVMFRQQRGVPA